MHAVNKLNVWLVVKGIIHCAVEAALHPEGAM